MVASRMPRDLRWTCWTLSLLLALIALAACQTAPEGAPGAEEVLSAKTRGEMLRVTTHEPTRCTWSQPGRELCL